MSRDLTPEVAAAIAAGVVRPALFYEGEFASGWARFWTGLTPMQWGGRTWNPAGALIGLSPIEETTSVVANVVTVTLSGVPTDLVALAIEDARQGKPGRSWLAFLDESGAIIPEPVQLAAGRLDVPEVEDGEDTCTIAISYETRAVDLTTPREWRYTHESQQVLFPGDLGLEFVTSLQEMEITWGR